MKNIMKLIAIAILASLSLVVVNGQEQTKQLTLVKTTEGSVTNEKETAETKKVSSEKRQSNSNDDSWTGFYIGGYTRYVSGKASANTSVEYSNVGYFDQQSISKISNVGTQRLKSNNSNHGGTFGYNYQKGKVLIGAEADFGSNKTSNSVSSTAAYPCCSFWSFTLTQSIKSDWIMTARPRAGVVLKKALLYATGGVAVTNIKYSSQFTDGDVVEKGSFTKIKTGWTAGGGIEVKAGRRFSVKGEYLFNQFGRTSIISNDFTDNFGPNSNTTNPFTHSTNLKSHSVRFGINYRF